MKSFTFAAVIGAASALNTTEFEYMQYIAKYNKVSNDIEMFNARMENFAKADSFIKEHNATESSYTVGHNQFSDWFTVEYKNMLRYAKRQEMRGESTLLDTSANADSVNWVTAGAVTPVKDQGSCGSCWAFSTTGSLEGAHFISKNELLSFSEEQLVECDTTVNQGCNGGNQDEAYKYYEAGNDAELESVYPYTSGSGSAGACKYDAASATAVTVSAYTNVTPSTMD